MVKITIETTVNAPLSKVWDFWTKPAHIVKWNAASDDWHTTVATNDLREGGQFTSRMEAKDGSFGFDFGGVYDVVKPREKIAYTMGDGRKVKVTFGEEEGKIKIVETFDAETENPVDLQRAGWQAILDNFRRYTEEN